MNLLVKLFCSFLIVAAMLFNGCQDEEPTSPDPEPLQKSDESVYNSDERFMKENDHLNLITLLELLYARVATAKYRNINKAIADGYVDINVVMPNMGYHYMKSEFVDETFEIGKPELLVYSPHPVTGKMRLVAVEYAVPIDLSPNSPPEGFTGNSDVWNYNTDFGLWLLHAWVWYYNPDGVFNPTNPNIP